MKLCCCLLLFLTISAVRAQERCATSLTVANQNRTENSEAFEQWLSAAKSLQASSGLRTTQTVYQIPVVFHVIHDGSEVGSGTNISDDRIIEQVAILNADYRRANADAADTPEEFASVAADAEIEFVLARQDPEGLPTTGIVRVKGSKSVYSLADDAALKAESYWDQDDYLNIYVTDISGGYLGYAQFPFSNLEGIASELKNHKATDGVVLDYKWVGTNTSTGSFDSYGRTATHEIGHYLGLRHIWGDGDCSVDDYCSDTPLSGSSTSGCPEDKASCSTEEMIQNYMDYTNDVCMNLFTECQKERMRTVLELSPRRYSLLSSPGLEDPVLITNDLGVRSITAPQQSDCSETATPSVQLRNYGSNTITSFVAQLTVNETIVETKSFTTSLETGATTSVSFNEITLDGTLDNEVTFGILSVNDSADNNALNDTKSVTLYTFASEIAPYSEDFETEQNLPTRTETGDSSRWTYLTAATSGNASNQAAVAPFYNQTSNFGYQDLLLTHTLDLSNLRSAQLFFRYAYACRQQEGNSTYYLDGLIVAISTSCGSTFSTDQWLMELYGRNLQTAGTSDFSFIPLDDSDWEELTFDLSDFMGESNVQIAFIGINGGGNNLYIDDITVTSEELLSYDAGLKTVSNFPVVSCDTYATPELEIKNYGSETINDLQFQVVINGDTSLYESSGLNIATGKTANLSANLSSGLFSGTNAVSFRITEINGAVDENSTNNLATFYLLVNTNEEPIPVKEDFENSAHWTVFSPNDEALFDTISLEKNIALYTDNFDNTATSKSYLVSPVILSGGNTEMSLRFRYSYAQRLNYNDNLKVLLSMDCGENFDVELLSLNSEQMALTSSSTAWTPQSNEDWETISIDLSEYADSDIRLAFVFSNGGGNRLYLDDINVLAYNDPSLPETWAISHQVIIYPNPASLEFYAAFNLEEKTDVRIQLIDMAGKRIFDKQLKGVLNDKVTFLTPHQSGCYILYVSGKGVHESKKLFIQR